MGKYYETPELRILTLRAQDVITASTGEGVARDFNGWLEGNPFGEVSDS